ncbi:hypothetical protein FSP39_000805 [Pinctada imbricata]|uniref:Transposable element P transposase-like RNase H domain-containing protein n=1 Tax=Pinctada imbricata TaxID=66713 RepID=A0AA89BRY5_PINIB|nr:hypothetical protein FSP39_000805 [Pinctada imbricata]
MCTIGEDKSYLAVRSDHCEQIVSISSETVCKNCRLFQPMNTCDGRRGHINTKTQESDHNTSCMFTDNKENNNEGKITEINCDEKNITSCEEGITESPNEILLDDNDHDDLSEILKSVFTGASENFKKLLESQHKALSAKSPSSRRWDKKIISICLSLWIRSPKAYATLQDSGMLILPSGRQLRRYKNCVPQETGIHDKILTWMREAALDAKVPPHGFCGGLHHDETKVQRDLILNMNDGKPVLIGWIDMGEESFNLKVLKDNEVKPELANEVLQVSFVGFTGFRFPICHFPTAGVKASDLHIIIWNCISKLWDYGFRGRLHHAGWWRGKPNIHEDALS